MDVQPTIDINLVRIIPYSHWNTFFFALFIKIPPDLSMSLNCTIMLNDIRKDTWHVFIVKIPPTSGIIRELVRDPILQGPPLPVDDYERFDYRQQGMHDIAKVRHSQKQYSLYHLTLGFFQ